MLTHATKVFGENRPAVEGSGAGFIGLAHTEVSDSIPAIIAQQSENQSVPLGIAECLPERLLRFVTILDKTVQSPKDAILVGLLTVLASLSNGATVRAYEEDVSDPLIFYGAFFAPSGMGKTSAIEEARMLASKVKEEIDLENKQIAEQRKRKEVELKALTPNQKDEKAKIFMELEELPKPKDSYISGATAEGLHASLSAGSTPHIFVDEFGKDYQSSKKNDHKAGFYSMLQQIYDTGNYAGKRTKDVIAVTGVAKRLGVYLASTIGNSNLKPADMQDLVADGFLNRFLVCFGDEVKDLPLRSAAHAYRRDLGDYGKKYHETAKNLSLVLSSEAQVVYGRYHSTINSRRKYKVNNRDDTAGLTIRMLKMSLRIAAIYHIIECTPSTLDGETILAAHHTNGRIGAATMEKAIKTLEYFEERHFSQINSYANSKSGKLTKEEKLFGAIKRLNDKGEDADDRTLQQNTNITKSDGYHAAIAMLFKSRRIFKDEQKNIYYAN